MVFHRRLCDSKSLQVSRTFLSILADINNAVVWMVSVPSTPITVGITVTFKFHSFFSTLTRSQYFYSILVHYSAGSLFLLIVSFVDYYYYYYYSHIRVFHISVSRWFFTGVWVTANLLKSPGLVSVFWPFSIMLSFGWSPPVRQLSSPPVPLVIL